MDKETHHMKTVSILLALAMVLTGGAFGLMTPPARAQVFSPAPPPPPQPGAMMPWVGQNTPWTYHNGDWFHNGILYYFFGPKYGWAPYYSYAPTYVVRPSQWYGPKWNKWYRAHPRYMQNFNHAYPYWREHRAGHHYGEDFYIRYHHGQGRGWQRGYEGR
jgi:hypothetical protein